jgi:hypothetical protein
MSSSSNAFRTGRNRVEGRSVSKRTRIPTKHIDTQTRTITIKNRNKNNIVGEDSIISSYHLSSSIHCQIFGIA